MHKSITSLLDKSYNLHYIDYRENFNGHWAEIEAAIQNQDWSHIDEIYEGWDYWEGVCLSVDYALDELKKEIESDFDVTEERAVEFVNKYRDELTQIIEDRDESTPISDLILNTEDPICSYDTGYEVGVQSWSLSSDEFENEIKNIKRALKIKIKDDTWDKELNELLANATYGGNLLIFFSGDIKKLMEIGQNGYKRIRFENMEIGIIDYLNGSGHNVTLNKSRLSLPLDVKKIELDLSHCYNYTDAVCGMSHNWCNSTDVTFSKR